MKLATLDSETEESTEGNAPTITSQNRSYFFEAKNGSFEITVTGSPSPSVTCEGDLPLGVKFEPSARLLSGSPSFGSRGDYPLRLSARNGIPPDFTQDFTLTVLFSGSLDVSFGNIGKVTTAFGTSAEVKGMVIQADGKILVAGYRTENSNIDIALARYWP